MKKRFIKPPFLSTSFSESGKRAKRRFANILNVSPRPVGAVVAVMALTLTLALGSMVSVASVPSPAAIDSRLFDDPVGYYADSGLTVGNGEPIGTERLDAFLAALEEKQPARLNVVKYREEGGPGLMTVTYDGESFSAVEYNRYGPYLSSYMQPYGPFEHLRVFVDGGTAYFYLVNDPDLTHEEIFHYQLSSAVIEEPPEFAQLFFVEGENGYETAIY